MAAFAQFGSDLDASTQQLLNRGSKLTELLKQNQFSPMTVAEQVISIFCGVKGYLDDLDLKEIVDFENKIIESCKADQPEIIEAILSSGKLDDDTEKQIFETFQSLKGKLTMLIVTHNKENLYFCDKIFNIKNKKIYNEI